jgi:hypothetical protein
MFWGRGICFARRSSLTSLACASPSAVAAKRNRRFASGDNSEDAAHLNRICSHKRGCKAYSSHRPNDDFRRNSPAHGVDITQKLSAAALNITDWRHYSQQFYISDASGRRDASHSAEVKFSSRFRAKPAALLRL